MTYSVSRPYLKNHKIHDFQKSLEGERKIIQRGDHLPVIHALNYTLEEKWRLSIDYDSFEDNYGNDPTSQFKNRAGVDASFDLVDIKSRKIKKKDFTIDYKFRDPNSNWIDFLVNIRVNDLVSPVVVGLLVVVLWEGRRVEIFDHIYYYKQFRTHLY